MNKISIEICGPSDVCFTGFLQPLEELNLKSEKNEIEQNSLSASAPRYSCNDDPVPTSNGLSSDINVSETFENKSKHKTNPIKIDENDLSDENIDGEMSDVLEEDSLMNRTALDQKSNKKKKKTCFY